MSEEEQKEGQVIEPSLEDDSIDGPIEAGQTLPLKPEEVAQRYLPDLIQTIPEKKRGKLPLKYKMLAEYAARGYPVKLIASMIGVKEAAVYRILETRPEVWVEINRIVGEIFGEGDRLLANLYKKALVKLDAEMESESPERRDKAIDKVLKCYGYNRDKEDPDKRPPILAQFISTGGAGPIVEDFDEMVKRKRRERGLKEDE